MLKKLLSALAALPVFVLSAYAITPDTSSMYDKIENVELLDLAETSMSAVYIVVGLILLLMVAAYLFDRRSRKKHGDRP